MTKKSFGDLFAKLEATPAFRSEKLAVTFLAELNAAMQEQGVTNAELARRIGVSPAYIAKLFRGPSNLTVETLAKLADAVGQQVHLHLASSAASVRWFDVFSEGRGAARGSSFDSDEFTRLRGNLESFNQDVKNDEKFALAA